jgi:hypothetical protein
MTGIPGVHYVDLQLWQVAALHLGFKSVHLLKVRLWAKWLIEVVPQPVLQITILLYHLILPFIYAQDLSLSWIFNIGDHRIPKAWVEYHRLVQVLLLVHSELLHYFWIFLFVFQWSLWLQNAFSLRKVINVQLKSFTLNWSSSTPQISSLDCKIYQILVSNGNIVSIVRWAVVLEAVVERLWGWYLLD